MNQDTAMALVLITLFVCVFGLVALRMWIDYRIDLAEVEYKND